MKLRQDKDEKKTEQQKVDERRAEVLAKGRQFKYPLQWTKHRVVINSVLIVAIVTAIIITSGWLALYRFGMTDEMLFRVTKIFPIPVANIDGKNVAFSDYLMFYRSSLLSIERQSGQVEQQGSIDELHDQYKRVALSEAEEYAYAIKLAEEMGITVTDEEIKEEFNRHLNIGGVERSEEGFMKIIEENFGLSRSEYEHMLYLALIKSKVETEIDTTASQTAISVESILADNGGDYGATANSLGSSVVYEETGALVSNQNVDGGRASEASKLEPGEQSGRFVSINGDGYYFVKLIAKTDTEVNFVSIKVPFTEFASRVDNLRSEDAVKEYITISSEE